MSSTPSNRQEQAVSDSVSVLPIIICVAAILRVVSIFILRTYLTPNTWEFGEIAHVIMAGLGYTVTFSDGVRVPSAYMPPFYPYLLTGLWSTLGESGRTYLMLELLQALLGVVLVFYIYRLASLLFSPLVASTAAVIAAVWPAFIYLCNEFHSINFYIVLGVAAVYHLVRYIELSRSRKDATCLGLYMGALFYCRAEAGLLLAVYATILVWRCGRKSLLHAAITCIIALACISPWTIRNYKVFGHPVVVTTSGGINLWVGHNPHATGNSTWSMDYATPEQQRELKSFLGRPDSEVLQNVQAGKFAVEFVRLHPQQEARLVTKKVFLFLLFDPEHKKGSHITYWGPSLLLLLVALYGAWLHKGNLFTKDLPLVASIAFAFFMGLAVFVVPRYRIAIDPFLVIFAANALVALFPRGRVMLRGKLQNIRRYLSVQE